jgi:hypothetical protein
MKNYDDFVMFCSGKLQSELSRLDNERGTVVKSLIFYRVIIGLMIVGVLAIIFSFELLTPLLESNVFYLIISVIFMIAYITAIVLLIAKQGKIRKNFVIEFKKKIINSIVSFFDEGLTYDPHKFISLQEFQASNLIRQRIDKYYGDDFVEGKIGQTTLKFSEVHAFYEENSDNKKRYVEIFGGVFFIGDFNKNFKGSTYVFPDRMEKTFGRFANFLQSLSKANGQLVKLEDIDFEKEFKVYSDDQIEARYILSTSLMQRILDFQKKAYSGIMLAFKDSKIYIAIPVKGSLFEPKIFGKLVSEDTLRKYYEDFSIAISAVEDLNLNLRIWGK